MFHIHYDLLTIDVSHSFWFSKSHNRHESLHFQHLSQNWSWCFTIEITCTQNRLLFRTHHFLNWMKLIIQNRMKLHSSIALTTFINRQRYSLHKRSRSLESSLNCFTSKQLMIVGGNKMEWQRFLIKMATFHVLLSAWLPNPTRTLCLSDCRDYRLLWGSLNIYG